MFCVKTFHWLSVELLTAKIEETKTTKQEKQVASLYVQAYQIDPRILYKGKSLGYISGWLLK